MFKLLKTLIFYCKEIQRQLKMKQKSKKRGFLGILLRTWGASFLGNLLGWKRVVRAGYGNKKEKWILRAGYG